MKLFLIAFRTLFSNEKDHNLMKVYSLLKAIEESGVYKSNFHFLPDPLFDFSSPTLFRLSLHERNTHWFIIQKASILISRIQSILCSISFFLSRYSSLLITNSYWEDVERNSIRLYLSHFAGKISTFQISCYLTLTYFGIQIHLESKQRFLKLQELLLPSVHFSWASNKAAKANSNDLVHFEIPPLL